MSSSIYTKKNQKRLPQYIDIRGDVDLENILHQVLVGVVRNENGSGDVVRISVLQNKITGRQSRVRLRSDDR